MVSVKSNAEIETPKQLYHKKLEELFSGKQRQLLLEVLPEAPHSGVLPPRETLQTYAWSSWELLDDKQTSLSKHEAMPCYAHLPSDIQKHKDKAAFLRVWFHLAGKTGTEKESLPKEEALRWAKLAFKHVPMPTEQTPEEVLDKGFLFDLHREDLGASRFYITCVLFRHLQEQPNLVRAALRLVEEGEFNFWASIWLVQNSYYPHATGHCLFKQVTDKSKDPYGYNWHAYELTPVLHANWFSHDPAFLKQESLFKSASSGKSSQWHMNSVGAMFLGAKASKVEAKTPLSILLPSLDSTYELVGDFDASRKSIKEGPHPDEFKFED
jgi:hypothetical protein